MSQTCRSAIECEFPHCQCEAKVYPWAARKHDIERRDWERRFTECISERAVDGEGKKLTGDTLIETVERELEVWPEEGDPHNGPDWMVTLPEDAAHEQMMNWLDDQEP